MDRRVLFDDAGDSSSSSEEEDMNEASQEESDGEVPVPQTPSKRKGKGRAAEGNALEIQNSIVPTAFDAYFTYTASKIQTSTNVFSDILLPLTAEEYTDGISAGSQRMAKPQTSILEPDRLSTLFSRFIFEMNEGFNVLCYGFGSKRQVLNQFATEVCSKHGHVVIVNAFKPDFALKDILHRIPHSKDFLLASTVEKQAHELTEHLRETDSHHVYILIHNIDAPSLRSAKAKIVLTTLASSPYIHVIASVDHINAPLLWSSSEMSGRKSSKTEQSSTSPRGFAWLWHDLTTLAPYDTELAFVDRSSISGASNAARSRKLDASNSNNPSAMSETAANHILASVTLKARKLFLLLGKRQIASIEESGGTGNGNNLQEHGTAYDALFAAARDDFIATNDSALRQLLTEFRDHSLVVSAHTASGTEVLWVPLRKERLASVIASLEVN